MTPRQIARAVLPALLVGACASGHETVNLEPLTAPSPHVFKAAEEPATTACVRAREAAAEPGSSQLLGGTSGQNLGVLRELARHFPNDSGLRQLSAGQWRDSPNTLVVLQCAFTPSSPGRPPRLVITDLGSRIAAFDQPQVDPGAAGGLVPISPFK